jgi:hypothetical protein
MSQTAGRVDRTRILVAHKRDGEAPSDPSNRHALPFLSQSPRNPLRRQEHLPNILSVLNEVMRSGGVTKTERPSNLRLDSAVLP